MNAGNCMQLSKMRIMVGIEFKLQSIRCALNICGTMTTSARVTVSPSV